GFGLTGIAGIIVIMSGLGLSFWKLDLRLAVIYTILSILALIGLVFWALYVFPHTATGKKFVLETRISVEDGYTTTLELQKYVGQEGVAASDLRPSGIARIGDERLDVVSDGDFIPRGTRIKVIQAKQTNLVVAKLPEPESPPKA
ncbi:MAG TPA: NfeD family protein, partial [Candidatus Ozemobacteraceae bacterium]|nr:NfeD family protein [Candidatus Ozemobacteraceae bacterium]